MLKSSITNSICTILVHRLIFHTIIFKVGPSYRNPDLKNPSFLTFQACNNPVNSFRGMKSPTNNPHHSARAIKQLEPVTFYTMTKKNTTNTYPKLKQGSVVMLSCKLERVHRSVFSKVSNSLNPSYDGRIVLAVNAST